MHSWRYSATGLLTIDQKVSVLLPQYIYGNRMTLHELSTLSGGLQGHDEDPDGDVTFGIVGVKTGNSTVRQVFANPTLGYGIFDAPGVRCSLRARMWHSPMEATLCY